MTELRHALAHAPVTFLLPALLLVVAAWSLPGFRSRRARAWLVVPYLWMALTLMFWSEADHAELAVLLVPGFALLGFLLIAVPAWLIAEALLWVLGRLWPHRVRRAPVIHATSLGALALTLYQAAQATRAPEAVWHEVTLPERHSSRLTIAQLSDLHLRGLEDRPRLLEVVRATQTLDADLVVITGDILDGAVKSPRRLLEPLSALTAKKNVYAVLGNHDLYAGAELLTQHLRDLGVTVLLNEHRVLEVQGLSVPLVLAGVTNPSSGWHGGKRSRSRDELATQDSDPRRAFAHAPEPALRVLLAHQPKSVVAARDLGVDLALVGHTHGGQFFPYTGLIDGVFPYPTGASRDGAMNVIVSGGLSFFGPPLRAHPPEITVISLR